MAYWLWPLAWALGLAWQLQQASLAPAVARWGGLLLAVAYAVFSGWGVPAQRTTLMLATVTVLRSVGVQWPWHVTLFGAAWVVLAADPWALLQPGFWLSFGAVAILFARDAVEPGGGWRKAWHQLREQSLLTLTMAPLTLWWFGQIAWVGVVANLLAVPAVTLTILPLAMAGVALPWLWSVADGAGCHGGHGVVAALALELAWTGVGRHAAGTGVANPAPCTGRVLGDGVRCGSGLCRACSNGRPRHGG